MKTTLARTLLAMFTLLSLVSLASAQYPGYSQQFNGQWHGSPQAYGMEPRLRQLAYLSEVSGGEEQLPDGAGDPFMNDNGYGGSCDCSGDGCSDGGCNGCDTGCCDGSHDCGGECCCDNGACCDGGCCGQGGCCAQGGCCGYDACGGGYGQSCGYGDCCDYGNCSDYGCQPNAGMFYSEVQLMFLRPNINEDVIGKLSEKYELSPRMIFGYEAPSGVGVRTRYWTYERTTPNLANANNPLRLEWNVIDLEGTGRFNMGRADLVVAGGFRWADIEVADTNGAAYTEMPGLTFAGDLRTAICCGCSSQWSAVCGARWSLLAGDWEEGAGAQGFIDEVRDDNMVVHEIYAGVEYCCHHCGYDLYARIVFEMQNWHSDVIGESSATDSIGFLGPGAHVGVSF